MLFRTVPGGFGRRRTVPLVGLALLVAAVALLIPTTAAAQAPQAPTVWVDVHPLPQTLFGPATTSDGAYNTADGKIYLNGGYSGSTIDTVVDTTWKYDPVANSFTVLAPSPAAQGGPAFGIINGHFLIAGGRTNPDETRVQTFDYNIAS